MQGCYAIEKSILLIKFREGGVRWQNILWCSTYGGQICATLQRGITTGGDTKEREHMIRKNEINIKQFNIKPDLSKKAN